ncbi:MAG: hypothetical protein KDJ16_16365, partial [Hyphomicrobiales bacterium]|nr:hypothetical protein [Hyphomicrobiales bacterium]
MDDPDETEGDGTPLSEAPEKPGTQTGVIGIGFLLFLLGIGVGFPLAVVGNSFISRNADVVAAITLGALLIVCAAGATLILLRNWLLKRIFHVASAQIEQFATPLTNTVRQVIARQPKLAMDSAEYLTRLALARWTWISTRRWIIASLTGLIAALAALAGTALLFRQNELLAVQTERLEDQNRLLQSQIGLTEAQRNAEVLSGLLDIGASLGRETAELRVDGRVEPIFRLAEISAELRARIIAISNLVRPYRYLRDTLVDLQKTDG